MCLKQSRFDDFQGQPPGGFPDPSLDLIYLGSRASLEFSPSVPLEFRNSWSIFIAHVPVARFFSGIHARRKMVRAILVCGSSPELNYCKPPRRQRARALGV